MPMEGDILKASTDYDAAFSITSMSVRKEFALQGMRGVEEAYWMNTDENCSSSAFTMSKELVA